MSEDASSVVGGVRSAAVEIRHDQVSFLAGTLTERFAGSHPQMVKWDDPLFWNIEGSRAERCQFLTIGNSMNFRFWTMSKGRMTPSGGLIEGRQYRGSMYLWRRLRLGVSRGEFSIAADWLSTLTEERLELAFQDDNGACPLLPGVADRAENLRNLGTGLLTSWDGEFVNVIEAASGSLDRFIELSADFRAFDDPIRKLTMVNAIMLTGSGLADFDRHPLPGIDYHLVRQAVRQGIISPSPLLAEKLRDRHFLSEGESLSLRQATLDALLKLSEMSHISTAVLDNIYWLNRRVCDEEQPACTECLFREACLQRVEMGSPLEATRYY